MGRRVSRRGRSSTDNTIPKAGEVKVETAEEELERLLPPSSASEPSRTPPPPNTETTWWLQSVIQFDIRALYDSGASTMLMDTVGVQIASSLSLADASEGQRRELQELADRGLMRMHRRGRARHRRRQDSTH